MCGILGVKIKVPSPEVAKNLLKIFKNQKERGTEGAGLSLLRNGVLKRIRRSDPFDLFSFEYADLWNNLQEGDCILIHHRFPTNGGGGNNIESNHPFSTESNSCHLIHNGIVSNDKDLFKELRKKGHYFESKVDGSITDSEVLVHMVENDAKGGCQRIVDKAKGSIAIAFQYAKDNKIYLWRRLNPIEVYTDQKENQYFSSEFPEGMGFELTEELDEHKLYALGDKLELVQKYKKPKRPKVEKYFRDVRDWDEFPDYDMVNGGWVRKEDKRKKTDANLLWGNW